MHSVYFLEIIMYAFPLFEICNYKIKKETNFPPIAYL